MVKLQDLFEQDSKATTDEWDSAKEDLKKNINSTLELGSVDPEVLLIMKELLDLAKVSSMLSYIED
jgi:hypothetical protein